jgi:hypothetical protein
MAGYREVFPWAESPHFSLGTERWMVDDQYCVQPGCNCTEAGLALYRLNDDATPAKAPTKCAVFLRNNYMNGKTEVEEAHPGSPAMEQLMQALRATHPELGQTLCQRHGQLKQLGRRLIPKSRRRSKRPFSYLLGDGLDADELPIPTASAPAATRAPQVGRNDPCPCGSGKKFKKCCGSVSCRL